MYNELSGQMKRNKQKKSNKKKKKRIFYPFIFKWGYMCGRQSTNTSQDASHEKEGNVGKLSLKIQVSKLDFPTEPVS